MPPASVELKELPRWPPGHDQKLFMNEVLGMMLPGDAPDAMPESHGVGMPVGEDPQREVRRLLLRVFSSFFMQGTKFVAVREHGAKESPNEGRLHLALHEMRVFRAQRQRDVPMLLVTWQHRDVTQGMLSLGTLDERATVRCFTRFAKKGGGEKAYMWEVTSKAAIARLKELLQTNKQALSSLREHPHFGEQCTKDWSPSFLLPLWVEGAAAPTTPNISLQRRLRSTAKDDQDMERLQIEHAEDLTSSRNGVPTHHFFITGKVDSLSHLLDYSRDAEGRVYIFEERKEAMLFAKKMGLGIDAVQGIGDQKWEFFQQSLPLVIVKKGSVAGAAGADTRGGAAEAARADTSSQAERTDIDPPSHNGNPLQKAKELKEAGNSHLKSGDLKSAIAVYQKAILLLDKWRAEGHPLSQDQKGLLVILHSNTAQAHINSQEWAEAERSSACALSEDGTHTKTRYRHAIALRGLGKWAQAAQFAQAALRDGGGDEFQKLLRELQEKTGRAPLKPPLGDFVPADFFLEAHELAHLVLRGLAEDSAFITHTGVPMMADLLRAAVTMRRGIGPEAEFLQITLDIMAERQSDGDYVALHLKDTAGIMVKVDDYLRKYSDTESQFKGLYLRGALSKYIDPLSAARDLDKAYQITDGKYPWVLLWSARAWASVVDGVPTAERLANYAYAIEHYEMLAKSLVRHAEQTRQPQAMLAFVYWEMAQVHYWDSGLRLTKESGSRSSIFGEMAKANRLQELRALAEKLQVYANKAEEVEEQCRKLEGPQFRIMNCIAKDTVEEFLLTMKMDAASPCEDLPGSPTTEKPGAEDSSHADADRKAEHGGATFWEAPLIIEDELEAYDSMRKAVEAKERDRATRLDKMQRGELSAREWDRDIAREFKKSVDVNAERRRQWQETFEARERLQAERDERLKEREVQQQRREDQWGVELENLQQKQGEVEAWAQQELEQQQGHFKQLYEDVEAKKEAELKKMSTEVARIKQEMRALEEGFDGEREALKAEQDRITGIFAETLARQDEMEARRIGAQHERFKLVEWQKRLQREDDAVATQAAEVLRLQSALEERQERLAKDRADLQLQQEVFGHLHGSIPASWSDDGHTKLKVVPVTDPPILESLQKCLHCQNAEEWLGKGRDIADVSASPYNRLSLKGAWRVENYPVWRKYCAEAGKIRSELEANSLAAPPEAPRLAEITANLDPLDTELNEVRLVHGTEKELVLSILQEGLNERFNSRAAYGFGSYLAEDAGKADQYVKKDPRFDRGCELHRTLFHPQTSIKHPGKIFYILVCRVLLGYAAHTRDSTHTLQGGEVWAAAGRRASKRELAYVPGSSQIRYHCEIMELTDEAQFERFHHQRVYRYREFVVPHSDRIYPEYLLAVQRTWESV